MMSVGELPPLPACWPKTALVKMSTANRTPICDCLIVGLQGGDCPPLSSAFLAKIPYQHQIRFGKLILDVHQRFPVHRRTQTPPNPLLQRPDDMRLAARKIQKCKVHMWKFSEFQEVDSVRRKRPIRPSSGIYIAEHFAFFAAL